MLARRLTYDEVKHFIEVESGSGCKLISEEYVKSNEKLDIECRCGATFSVRWNTFKSQGKRECNTCSTGMDNISTKKKTNEEFTKEVEELWDGEYTFLERYINSDTKIKVVHNKCGHVYSVAPKNFLMKRKCPNCFSLLMTKYEDSLEFKRPDIAKEWHPTKNEKTPDRVRPNSKTEAWWKCDLGHTWKCQIWGRTYWNSGCPICSGQVLCVGFNDMWTTHPELASMLANPEDGYKNFALTDSVNLNWICPNCGNKIVKKPFEASLGLRCNICSDGISYPEKVMISFLRQANIEFESQKTFHWSQRKRYDFYLPEHNWIIEVHGEQHYNGAFERLGGNSLENEIKNDNIKMNFALNNGIRNYVTIKADKSDPDYLKNKILNSSLEEISMDVDWKNIFKEAEKSVVVEVWKNWNNGIKSFDILSKKNKVAVGTIRNYLRRGEKLGVVDYSSFKNKQTKEIVQLDLDGNAKTWNSIKEAGEAFGTYSPISNCCAGRSKTAYGYRWMYKEDYDAMITEHGKIVDL